MSITIIDVRPLGSVVFSQSKRAKRMAAAVLILLGLILAIINPDRIAPQKARVSPVQPVKKTEAMKDSSPRCEILRDKQISKGSRQARAAPLPRTSRNAPPIQRIRLSMRTLQNMVC